MDPTPEVTDTVVRLGNLHPGFDGTAFLLVFVLGFVLVAAVILVGTRPRRS